MDHGFFPNVTRSNTTSKNALVPIRRCTNNMDSIDMYYVSRVYQTRHGNGYMSDESVVDLINNETETNVLDRWQGNFRTGKLDRELIRYALAHDRLCTDEKYNENIVFTCADQIPGKIQLADGSSVNTPHEILPEFKGKIYVNSSREGNFL
jgi:adenylosuccinate synthase